MKTPEQFTEHQTEIAQLHKSIIERHANYPEEAETFIKAIPGYVDNGSEHYVFRSTVPGRLIKLPLVMWSRNPEGAIDPLLDREMRSETIPAFNDYVTALECGKGAPRIEQIIGATTSRAIGVVVEEIDAQPLSSRQRDYRLHAPDFHTLFDAYEGLHGRGLVCDAAPSNVLHQPGDGFYLIDYKLRSTDDLDLEDSILHFVSGGMLLQQGDPAAASAYVAACRERYGLSVAEQAQELLEMQMSSPDYR